MKLTFDLGSKGSRYLPLGCAVAAWLLTASPIQAADAPPTKVMPWISEVVKMNDAGITQDVIANYIKNSTARSALSADDIIYLRDHNIPSGIITDMIEHGATVPSANEPAPAPSPAYAQALPPQYYQPPANYVEQQPAAVYNNYSYPDYSYGGYGPGYSYSPYWYSYYPYYPVWYYPFGYSYGYGGRFGFHRGYSFFGGGRQFAGGGGFHGIGSAHAFAGGIGHEGRR